MMEIAWGIVAGYFIIVAIVFGLQIAVAIIAGAIWLISSLVSDLFLGGKSNE